MEFLRRQQEKRNLIEDSLGIDYKIIISAINETFEEQEKFLDTNEKHLRTHYDTTGPVVKGIIVKIYQENKDIKIFSRNFDLFIVSCEAPVNPITTKTPTRPPSHLDKQGSLILGVGVGKNPPAKENIPKFSILTIGSIQNFSSDKKNLRDIPTGAAVTLLDVKSTATKANPAKVDAADASEPRVYINISTQLIQLTQDISIPDIYAYFIQSNMGTTWFPKLLEDTDSKALHFVRIDQPHDLFALTSSGTEKSVVKPVYKQELVEKIWSFESKDKNTSYIKATFYMSVTQWKTDQRQAIPKEGKSIISSPLPIFLT